VNKLALLHLAHPDTFEPIVSSDHKNLIAGRLAVLRWPIGAHDRAR
jgi:hypothetical protein